MDTAATLIAQYDRLVTITTDAATTYPAIAEAADNAGNDLTTRREIGPDHDETAFKKAFRHINAVLAATGYARTKSGKPAERPIGTLNAVAREWIGALNAYLARAQDDTGHVATALDDYDRIAATAGQR